MTATLTPRERELARHALGLDGRRKRSYRNYFAANNSGDDYAAWLGMEQRSLARSYVPPAASAPLVWFYLTRAGALAALEPGEMLDSEDFPG